MTRTPAPDPDDTKAKAFFATCLTVGAGFAGLVVAGLVLGFHYLLHGEPDERKRVAQQRADSRRSRYDDALSWLEADRADRERHRRAVRDWFNADPATRGEKPSSAETVGRAAGRAWRNLLVGWRRFKNGWDKGRAEARQRRDDGTPNWWHRPDGPASGTQEPSSPEPESDPAPVDAGPQPAGPGGSSPEQQPEPPDIVDAEIIPESESASRAVVPVGDGNPQFQPDPALDDYQRRLNHLGDQVVATSNGHDPNQPTPHAPFN